MQIVPDVHSKCDSKKIHYLTSSTGLFAIFAAESDKCGNPAYDPSKMAYITYSRYNKPLEVSASATDMVRYSYTSTGTKLRREVESMSSAADGVTDYSYNFLYEDNELVCIFAPFGRVTPMNTYQDGERIKHEQFAKDPREFCD